METNEFVTESVPSFLTNLETNSVKNYMTEKTSSCVETKRRNVARLVECSTVLTGKMVRGPIGLDDGASSAMMKFGEMEN